MGIIADTMKLHFYLNHPHLKCILLLHFPRMCVYTRAVPRVKFVLDVSEVQSCPEHLDSRQLIYAQYVLTKCFSRLKFKFL